MYFLFVNVFHQKRMKQSMTGKREFSALRKERAKQPKLITRDKTQTNFKVPLYFQMQRLPATTIIKKNIPDRKYGENGM